MIPRKFAPFSAVICYLLVMAAAEPQCENVEDFGSCAGDPNNFCPPDIQCVCRDATPYCSCPYYRGPNGNYWYMGEKCDQLWNTLDLILVTVLPAVSLAFVVGVVAQLIHYCKTKPSKKTRRIVSGRNPKSSQVNINLEKLQPSQGIPQNAVFLGNLGEQRFQYSDPTPPQNFPPNTPIYFQSASNLGNGGITLPQQGYNVTSRQERPQQGYNATSRQEAPQQGYNATSRQEPLQQGYNAINSQEPPQQEYNATSRQQPPQQGYNATSRQEPPQQGYNASSRQEPPQQGYNVTSRREPPQQGYNATSRQEPPQQGYNATSRQEPPQQFNRIPTQQNYDSLELPDPDYGQEAPFTSSTDWSSKPFTFRRPQIRNDYKY
ncbi:protein SSXT-like [Spea bombifrons]|uniref:protein SSXT-like n=1 Tax=Spea bombifrons TaxID=233779 RepID=UPI00234A7537|nr:protein SSXT-like [Spea bombifrons]